MSLRNTLIALLLSTLSFSVLAQNNVCSEPKSGKANLLEVKGDICLLLGGGVGVGTAAYSEKETETVFPVIYLTYGRFFWDTTKIGYHVVGEETGNYYWALSPLVEFPMGGFDAADDDDHLRGLDGREATLEGGIRLLGGGSWGVMEVGLNIDLESAHDGSTLYAKYGYPINKGKLTITPELSWRHRDEKYSDYFFGVDGDEIDLGNRDAYVLNTPTDSFDFGYSVSYALNTNWTVFHSLVGSSPDELINNSPITDNDEPYSLIFGALYRVF